MTCNARTRAGTPCKRRDLFANGRCRLHGGLSTGPLTPEGKRRSSMNSLLKGVRPAKEVQAGKAVAEFSSPSRNLRDETVTNPMSDDEMQNLAVDFAHENRRWAPPSRPPRTA